MENTSIVCDPANQARLITSANFATRVFRGEAKHVLRFYNTITWYNKKAAVNFISN